MLLAAVYKILVKVKSNLTYFLFSELKELKNPGTGIKLAFFLFFPSFYFLLKSLPTDFFLGFSYSHECDWIEEIPLEGCCEPEIALA